MFPQTKKSHNNAKEIKLSQHSKGYSVCFSYSYNLHKEIKFNKL